LRTLDLFSGIGGISLALQPWCETVCYCEIDPYAAGSLIKDMAEGNLGVAPIWDNVTTFGRSEIDQVGPIECITGGFPCQDISCAGKGAGITGSRSGLFFEIIRIIRLARPRIVFLENVPAILVRGLDTVLGELAESGYNARWKVLSAAEVGASHLRDRFFLFASDTNSFGLETLRNNGGGEKIYREGPSSQNNTIDAVKRFWETTSRTYRGIHGIPNRVDRLRCLGNAVVPQQARKAFEILMENE